MPTNLDRDRSVARSALSRPSAARRTFPVVARNVLLSLLPVRPDLEMTAQQSPASDASQKLPLHLSAFAAMARSSQVYSTSTWQVYSTYDSPSTALLLSGSPPSTSVAQYYLSFLPNPAPHFGSRYSSSIR